MVLDEIYRRTLNYNETVKNEKKKGIAQYFTPPEIAKFMAGLSSVTTTHVKILDAGAGTGMLGAAAVIKILENTNVESIHLDLFETDQNVLNLLSENMALIKKYSEEKRKNFSFNIIQENFICFYEESWKGNRFLDENEKYDLAIGNPPYKKIRKDAIESKVMSEIVHGQPNLYFLFIAMATSLLKTNGEIIYIVPRSFTSGLYFCKFREYFLKNIQLTNIHLFTKRKGIFKEEKILQELMIFRAVRNVEIDFNELRVEISTSDSDLDNRRSHDVQYDTIVEFNTHQQYIRIPETDEELRILNLFNRWNENLLSLGFKMKTGPVVEFRSTEYLIEKFERNITIPLLWPCNIKDNTILHPVLDQGKSQYFIRKPESLNRLVENQNYLIIKRFASKEENRRLVPAIYEGTLEYENIAIENHLNYVVKENGRMSESELYGLFALFNSSYLDKYYRILNGSTQVNSSEVNTIPLPTLNEIEIIGNQLIDYDVTQLTTEVCDHFIDQFIIE